MRKSLPRQSQHSVHPHVCGEHQIPRRPPLCTRGSSPRVWGTFNHLLPQFGICRFIPTCVGNISCRAKPINTPSVHPHVCGEHHKGASVARLPVWFIPTCVGNMQERALDFLPFRFIPTCVGNMRPPLPSRPTITVHPHVCGEHILTTISITEIIGSSPRVWGTSILRPGAPARSRFIPTCVGNIQTPVHGSRWPSVHPHVCGEHVDPPRQQAEADGSSPRVWGT